MRAKAEQIRIKAGRHRQKAFLNRDICAADTAYHLTEAEQLEKLADEALELVRPTEIGAGGEIVPEGTLEKEHMVSPPIKDTLKNPVQTNLDASLTRAELLADNNVLALGLDAAESAGAKNSLEKMLMHQMASCHMMGLKIAAQVDAQIQRLGRSHGDEQQVEVEILRKLVNSCARLTDTYQRGLQTLVKVRTGGKQIVQHQYVQVNAEGGQTLVAGNIKQKRE